MQAAIAYVQVLSRNGIVEKPSFTVYPNPFETEIYVVGTNNTSENVQAELYNTLGQRVSQKTFVGETVISTDGLQKGMYFLKLTQNGKTTTQKVVKK